MPGSSAGFIQSPCSRQTTFMRVSARLQASAAPDAPAPMISTSAVVSAICVPSLVPTAVHHPTASVDAATWPLAFGGRMVENRASMLSFALDFSLPLLCVGVVTFAIVLAVAGLLVARRVLPAETLDVHHYMTSAQFQVMGTIYAVLLAFVIITVWQHHSAITTTLEEEAANLLEL